MLMRTKECTAEEYKAKRYAQRRQWALDNPEKVKGYGRSFYKRNRERRKAYSKEYNELHREERRAYSREYYRRKKAEDPCYVKKLNERNKKNRKLKNPASLVPMVMGNSTSLIKKMPRQKVLTKEEHYEKLVKACKKTLNEYLYSSLERDRIKNLENIQKYFVQYPFDKFGERAIKRRLGWFGIHKNKAMYDDCYDAGVMAYMYSIHRCGACGYDYFLPYMYKMIRIYILCALIIYNDSKNICKINGMKQICIDKEENMQRY